MKIEVSIGEMHRFELRDALLIYRENRRSFITWHKVTSQQQGPPLLGPAQPLTTAFVEDLAESLSSGAAAELLPENVLAKTDRRSPGGHRGACGACSSRMPRARLSN